MNKLLTFSDLSGHEQSIPAVVTHLLGHFTALWSQMDTSTPELGREISVREKLAHERQVEAFVNSLIDTLKSRAIYSASDSLEASEAERSRLIAASVQLIRALLGLEDREIDVILSNGFIAKTSEFARKARTFDPAVSSDDIYQAGRNVWTMNFFQLLLGLPVQITPSVFAFSMLYPYTDNYLDDPAIPLETKLSFNERFHLRLSGDSFIPINAQEALISELIGMIEGQYDRAHFPQVYDSLLALHLAQSKSVGLLKRSHSLPENKVLQICFEKGGASGLADGYLVAGALDEKQQAFTFLYGIYTQLIDDVEDMGVDSTVGISTIFTQTARRDMLEAFTNRTFYLGDELIEGMACFSSSARGPFSELLVKCLPILLITSVGSAQEFYSLPYLHQLETYLPLRFSFLERQKKKLVREKVNLNRLMNFFVT